MANIPSAAKRARQNKRREDRNASVIATLKTWQKKFQTAVSGGNKEAVQSAFAALSSCLDKAAKRGVIHKNFADRKKSSIGKLVRSC